MARCYRDSVKKITMHHWNVIGKAETKAVNDRLTKQGGKKASIDHTYKVVSNLVAYVLAAAIAQAANNNEGVCAICKSNEYCMLKSSWLAI